MTQHQWAQTITEAVIVCDKCGVILEINDRALEFNHSKGKNLIGTNVIDCHLPATQPKVEQLLQSGERHMNVIQADGKTFITYYAPWHQDGQYAGLVEFILEVPPDKHHFLNRPSSIS